MRDGEDPRTWFNPDAVVRSERVEIDAPAESGAPVDSIFFNYARLTYRKGFAAQNDRLEFSGDQRGEYRASGFTSTDVVTIDIGDPANPRLLRGISLEAGEVHFNDEHAPLARAALISFSALWVGWGMVEGHHSKRDDKSSPRRPGTYYGNLFTQYMLSLYVPATIWFLMQTY